MRLIDADKYGAILKIWIEELGDCVFDTEGAAEARAIHDCVCQLDDAPHH